MSWYYLARDSINSAYKTVPEFASLKERMKIIDAAYPFGDRSNYPYKAWLKERKEYKHRHDKIINLKYGWTFESTITNVR